MISKLLAFSRRERLTLLPIDLSHTLREALQVLERVLPEHIELENPDVPLLHKPWGMRDFAVTIRAALDAQHPPATTSAPGLRTQPSN